MVIYWLISTLMSFVCFAFIVAPLHNLDLSLLLSASVCISMNVLAVVFNAMYFKIRSML